jgi:hypothetical protein
VIAPVFQIASVQEVFQQPEKAIVMDVFPQNGEQDGVVQRVETLRDIAFYKPFGSYPRVIDFL